MMRAREFMSVPVVSVRADATFKDVVEQMVAHNVSGVPVIDHSGTLVGILSESDILAQLMPGKPEGGLLGLLDPFAQTPWTTHKLTAHTAAEIMTTQVITAGPKASFRELVYLMTAHDVNRIPIVEGGRVIGIVTRADLLKAIARSDETITQEARWRLLYDLSINPAALKISTHDGIIVVAGEVATRSEAELVTRWVAGIDGAVDVDTSALRYRLDDLHIKSPGGGLEPPRK
jgi:CBS domain-containing protein